VDLKLDFAKKVSKFWLKKSLFLIFLSKFPEKKAWFLTKFSTKFYIFLCIIKHFHPPSWRLSGPETGFCRKIIKNWLFEKNKIGAFCIRKWYFENILTQIWLFGHMGFSPNLNQVL